MKRLLDNMPAYIKKAFATTHAGAVLSDPYVKFLGQSLEEFLKGETKRLIVALPPQHLKSFIFGVCYSTRFLIENPGADVLVVAAAQDLAVEMLRKIREIMASSWWQELSKTCLVPSDQRVSVETKADGRIIAKSIDGKFTGIRADLIIVDDPSQIRDRHDVRKQDAVYLTFMDQVLTRRSNPKEVPVVVIAHRLSDLDLPERLLRQKEWHYLALPLIQEEGPATYRFGNAILTREQGNILRPNAYDANTIAQLRSQDGFQALFQQDTSSCSLLALKHEHFQITSGRMGDSLPIVISVDPAQSLNSDASSSAILVIAVDGPNFVLVDQFCEQVSYPDFRKELRHIARKYLPSAILVENNGPAGALKDCFSKRYAVSLVTPRPHPKLDRLRTHAPLLRAGHLKIADTVEDAYAFVEELVNFPHGETDRVDALVLCLDYVAANPHLPKRPTRAVAFGTSPPRSLGPGSAEIRYGNKAMMIK